MSLSSNRNIFHQAGLLRIEIAAVAMLMAALVTVLISNNTLVYEPVSRPAANLAQKMPADSASDKISPMTLSQLQTFSVQEPGLP